MALRAGYYGLKIAAKRKLEQLAEQIQGMLIIKSIGSGLTLSQAGELSADSTSWNYSILNPVKTGQKWLDENDIYMVTISFPSPYAAIGYQTWGSIYDNFAANFKYKFDKILYAASISSSGSCSPLNVYYDPTNDKLNVQTPRNGSNVECEYLIILSTLTFLTENKKRKVK